MAIQNNLREELIKQFPAEVVELTDADGETNLVCPTCKRHVLLNKEQCPSCGQKLSWTTIKKEVLAKVGLKKASLSFEVPGDFSKSDCRKCPLSYITKRGSENIYECPLNMRSNCPLDIS